MENESSVSVSRVGGGVTISAKKWSPVGFAKLSGNHKRIVLCLEGGSGQRNLVVDVEQLLEVIATHKRDVCIVEYF